MKLRACTTCAPCEQDPCCAEGAFSIFTLVEDHSGCCDCSGVGLHLAWNFTANPVTLPLEIWDDCQSPLEVTVPSNYPPCLEARMANALALHGGIGQVEIYVGTDAGYWPEYQQIGIPDVVSSAPHGMSGAIRLVRGIGIDAGGGAVFSVLCKPNTATWITEGECSQIDTPEDPRVACDWRIISGQIGIIVRAADGYEVLRCVQCVESGEDIPISPCSSSSSTTACSCSLDFASSQNGYGETDIVVAAVFVPADCDPGTGEYTIQIDGNTIINSTGLATVALAACVSYAITATFEHPSGVICTDYDSITVPCDPPPSSSSSGGA